MIQKLGSFCKPTFLLVSEYKTRVIYYVHFFVDEDKHIFKIRFLTTIKQQIKYAELVLMIVMP